MNRTAAQQPPVRERLPYKQDPRQCRHVYLELGREGGTVVFFCERCLNFEERQLPAILQPDEKELPKLGFDALRDI